jgi:DNA-binding IclR family transcriptional regulator
MTSVQVEETLELIRLEYAEMPGLKLTLAQAQRLLSMPGDACERALAELTRSGFLYRSGDGAYGRQAQA